MCICEPYSAKLILSTTMGLLVLGVGLIRTVCNIGSFLLTAPLSQWKFNASALSLPSINWWLINKICIFYWSIRPTCQRQIWIQDRLTQFDADSDIYIYFKIWVTLEIYVNPCNFWTLIDKQVSQHHAQARAPRKMMLGQSDSIICTNIVDAAEFVIFNN